MKKNMFLISFFKSSNIGDILISKQISEVFKDSFFITKACAGSYCVVDEAQLIGSELYQDLIPFKRKLLKKFPFLGEVVTFIRNRKNKSLEQFEMQSANSDVIMIAGGNVIMDLGILPIYTYQIMNIVKAAKKSNKIVYLCYIGVGPLRTSLQKKYARQILELADFISVRDDTSYSLVKSLDLNLEVEIWSDPVLNISPDNGFSSKKAFGINVYFGHERNKKTIKNTCYAFAEIIKSLRKEKPDYKVILFSTELSDMADIKQVQMILPEDNMVIICKINSIQELFRFYENVEVVLGTRMHSIITSLICNKPIVSICWQEKVRGLVRHFNLENNLFEMNKIHINTNSIVLALIQSLENKDLHKLEIQNRLELINKATNEKVNEFIMKRGKINGI